jgi:hypothetical protein
MSCDVAYDELAAYTAGETDGERALWLDAHAAECADCRSRLDALRRSDAALALLRPVEPSQAAVLATRRLLADEIREKRVPEILTLEEVAEFLRIRPEELEEIVEELPAFELAGRIRVRREKLVEWVEEREKRYLGDKIESQVARIFTRRSARMTFGLG